MSLSTQLLMTVEQSDKASCKKILNDAGPGGGEECSPKFLVGVCDPHLETPHFRPKSVIFNTLFETWSKNQYHISYQSELQ